MNNNDGTLITRITIYKFLISETIILEMIVNY